jgi:predicted regulator of Ras-like GTPase activity (Roadblock/LC7/MglB family)
MRRGSDDRYGWLINDFAGRVSGVVHGVAVSADGLVLAASDRLPADRTEQLAAVTSGLVSLTDCAARCFDAGEVHETIVEMDAGVMLVMSLGDGSSLTVLADAGHDLGEIAYEMTLLADQVGRMLATPVRDFGGERKPASSGDRHGVEVVDIPA